MANDNVKVHLFTKNQILLLMDGLDEWIYENGVIENKKLERPIRYGRFRYPNTLPTGFIETYKSNRNKSLCKLILFHYGKILFKDEKHTLLINEYRVLYNELNFNNK